jgi:hypothetical protein
VANKESVKIQLLTERISQPKSTRRSIVETDLYVFDETIPEAQRGYLARQLNCSLPMDAPLGIPLILMFPNNQNISVILTSDKPSSDNSVRSWYIVPREVLPSRIVPIDF